MSAERSMCSTVITSSVQYTCVRSSGLPVASRGIVGKRAQKSGHQLASSSYWMTSSSLASVTFHARNSLLLSRIAREEI